VIRFADGTTADRVPYVPWLYRRHADLEIVFRLSDANYEELYVVFYRASDGRVVVPAVAATESSHNVHRLFEKNSISWSRKIRALAQALDVSTPAPATNDGTLWLVSDLVRWKTFVADMDMKISNRPKRLGESTISYVDRVLPGFRLFSWYDPEAPAGWMPEEEVERPPAVGGPKSLPFGQWPGYWPYGSTTSYEYVLAADEGSSFPEPFVRIGHFANRGWNVSTSALPGRDARTICRLRFSYAAGDPLSAGSIFKPFNPREWANLRGALNIHFYWVMGLIAESGKRAWLEHNVSDWSWEALTTEEVELFQMLGEAVPVSWEWATFKQWAADR